MTFYSFKGGVGRTTTLAACALLAAQAGESVVVVDLDLEAPGAGSLFGVDEPPRGVLDLLVDHLATGKVELQDAVHTPRGLPNELTKLLRVIPAGQLDLRYLEKLARLDFTGSAVEAGDVSSPVQPRKCTGACRPRSGVEGTCAAAARCSVSYSAGACHGACVQRGGP